MVLLRGEFSEASILRWNDEPSVPMHSHACPARSYYMYSVDTRDDTDVQRNYTRSDAPLWAECD
jgi:hypothetical protein